MDDSTSVRLAPPPGRRPRRIWWLLTAVIVAGLLIYLFWLKPKSNVASSSLPSSSGKSGKGGGAGGPINVVATRAGRGSIGVYFAGLGAVTPIYTVTVRSRVDGELMSVNYREGDMVKKGDVLVEIDPRPYQAALTEAQGVLLRDQAALENARIDLLRYQTLIKTKAIPEQQLATQQATVKQDEGIVKADEGALANAQVNVDYTTIAAPIAGRVGLRLVDPGNIVHSTDSNSLVVITQMDPISVLFTVSEDQLPEVVQKNHAGKKLPVEAWDREMKNKIAQGVLTTIDNEIDQTTGTVRLRATFDNKKGALFPNQFVNARLLVETHRNAVLLPTAAIERTSSATFVFLVQPDSKVTMRNITVGVTEGDQSEITSGLNPGDEVVMSGADKLEEGSKVTAELPGEPKPNPPAPPGGAAKTSGAAKSSRGAKRK